MLVYPWKKNTVYRGHSNMVDENSILNDSRKYAGTRTSFIFWTIYPQKQILLISATIFKYIYVPTSYQL